MLTFGVVDGAQAATRDEISAITVKKSGNFQYWNKDAESTVAAKILFRLKTESLFW